MTKCKKIAEFDLLEAFVDEMERRGSNRNVVRLDVDESMAVILRRKTGAQITVDEVQKLADKCLANEWLEYRVLAGKYGQLGLTSSGLGTVRTHQHEQERLKNRSWLKKTSDYIEDHKGLFVALGAAIALAGLLLRLLMRSAGGATIH